MVTNINPANCAPSEAVDEFQVLSAYKGTDGASGEVYIVAPATEYKTVTAIRIAAVCQKDPTPFSGEAFAASFVLAWEKSPDGIHQKHTLVVTVKQGQWQAKAAARKQLRHDFVQVALCLDKREGTSQSELVPGATRLIMRRIAEKLPAPLSETPFYLFGFSSGIPPLPASPYVDLLPGMRLLVQPAVNQLIGPGASLNGPVTAGTFTAEVCGVTGSDGARRIGFNAFLGAISAPKVPNEPVSERSPQRVIGGLLDLQAAGVARRYWRLCFPTKYPPVHLPGDVQLGNSVTLIGADSLGSLEKATEAYQAGAPADDVDLRYAVFRGRPTVIPELPILLNEVLTHVPVGTTVRQVVESHMMSNPAHWETTKSSGQQVSLWRYVGMAADELPSRKPVRFYPGTRATFCDPREFELPLAPADRVQVK
ncbi:hypothetical protein [Streptomyces chrestomyceticus]|uniref:hypothetical protein n=1 Tax=Streptomyces chrestomyceticus TaxID=68185 RepID=UPI0037A5A3D5